METATIRWNDGTELETRVNGTCYITDEKPDFPDDLTDVEVITEDGQAHFANPKIIECAAGFEPGYWFTLVEKGETEQVEQNTANIDYIAMMTDVDLPEA